MYVILQDMSQYLGEGYSSSSNNEFLGITKDFKTARNIIEYFADHTIGEERNYDYCDDECKKGYCGDCIYFNHASIEDEDWNTITLDCDDIFSTCLTYHFIKVES